VRNGAGPERPGPQGREREILNERHDGVIVHVHVQPRAGRTHLAGRHGDALRIRVAAPPVDGRATAAACAALADALGVAHGRVTLATGERSRLKQLHVQGMTLAEAAERLAPWLDPAGP
jgi:uncharacterized protein (TIGR00251 family)